MNTKWIKCLIATFLLCVGLTTSSWANAHQGSVNSDVAGPNRIFGAVQWYNLHDNFSSAETLDQSIWGGMVGYQYADRMDWYFLARGLWSGGKGDKNGTNMFSHPWYVEGRLGFQFGFGEGHEFGMTPYVGYQYNHSKTSVRGANHFIFKTQDVNVGVLFDWMVMPEFQIGLNVEALISVSGRLEEHNQASVLQNETKLKNEVNWLFELPLTWQFSPSVDFTLVPYFKWAEYRQKEQFTSFEKIKTDESGVRLEIGYRF